MENWLHRIEALEVVVQEMNRTKRRMEAQLRLWRIGTGALTGLLLIILPLQTGRAQGDADAKLQALLQHLVIENGGADLIITDANLHIRNGAGRTDTRNGRGNLIVGYNERRTDGTNAEVGSHNLVVGPRHNFPSYGGLVVGFNSEIRGRYSSVTAGTHNVALGDGSSVTGGQRNTAQGDFFTIGGGLCVSGTNPYCWKAGDTGGFCSTSGCDRPSYTLP
jgi:hypothetical protein